MEVGHERGTLWPGQGAERTCLKLQNWLEEDRRLWQAACRPSDLLDAEPTGARADHAIMSNRKAEKGYGRWLTFLETVDPGCLVDQPADRITPERVRRYVDSLICLGNSTATIIARLRELGEVARIMGPDKSWSFINALRVDFPGAPQAGPGQRQSQIIGRVI